LHAFDANLLQGNIIVRRAKKGEKLSALDEETYTLNSDMLVIADEKKALAIAGVMGGMETGVTEGTHNIILESALFDPVSVRKTSKTLGLRSESSSRFEKGVDAKVVEEAIDLAASMIQDVAGGTILNGIVSAGSVKDATKSIKLPITEVTRILGIDVTSAKVKSILQSLGFAVTGSSKVLNIKVPSWRVHDVHDPIDLIEEIGRIMDYNTMPKTLPSTELTSPVLEPLHQLRHNLRHYLAGVGYSEILTYSFYDEASIKLSGIGQSHHIKLTNPVNDEYPYLRTSMLPWMLNKLSQNSSLLAREQFQMFEIGKVFHKTGGEHWQASIGLINTQATDEQLYRQLRGVLESFVGAELSSEKESKHYTISKNKHVLGTIEVFPKSSISGLRFRSSTAVMLINLEELTKVTKKERIEYESIPQYPVVERDLGVVVPNVVQYKELIQSMERFNPLIKIVQLFDVYHGLDKGVSLALRLTFSSTDRTLEAKEVDEVMEKLRSSLEKKYKVSFR
jgi:phenylalanyl-tRNA synthetase beta chain